MVKWEHTVGRLPRDTFTIKQEEDVIRWLSEVGRDGWELVAVYEGLIFFKRPIEASLREQFEAMRCERRE